MKKTMRKGRKGQLTIEFLIILVLMLLLFSAISLDLITSSLEDAYLIQSGEMIKSADFLVSNTVEAMTLQGPGAKKSVTLRAPVDCSYEITAARITVKCDPDSVPYDEYNGFIVGPETMPSGVGYSSEKEEIKSGHSGAVEIAKT